MDYCFAVAANDSLYIYLHFLCPRAGSTPLWECPWFCADDLAFAISPEIYKAGREVVDGRVRALVEEDGGQSSQGEDCQASFQAAMERRSGKESQWPLEGEHADAHEEVDDL